MRQIITWGGSWYKIGSARVPACVRRNECMPAVRAHLLFVHVPLVWLREDEYILLEAAARHCDQSTQGCRDNASTCATWLHEL